MAEKNKSMAFGNISAMDGNLFYDSHLSNPNTSWTLWAAPWVKGDVGYKVAAIEFSKNTWIPILSGIISNPEIGFSGSHDFSAVTAPGSNVVNTLKETANQYLETSAVYKGLVTDVKTTGGGLGEIATQIGDAANEALDTLIPSDIKSVLSRMIGTKVITSLDFVKVYKGTNLDISIPALETRIYHGVGLCYHPDESKPRPATVKNKLNELLTRFVGPLQGFSESRSHGEATIDTLLGAQTPPNGYTPSFKQLSDGSAPIVGSFVLEYGKYELRNLLIRDFSFNISTMKVRSRPINLFEFGYATTKDSPVVVSEDPLYLDVRVSLMSSNYISNHTIKKIFNI